LRIFSFGGYGLALSALALAVFGAIECPPKLTISVQEIRKFSLVNRIFVQVRSLGQD